MSTNRTIEPDCNNCQPNIKCSGRIDSQKCKSFKPPRSGWILAEMALEYPTGLNAALSTLPYDVNLNLYLKGM